jgi:hypothetical protein
MPPLAQLRLVGAGFLILLAGFGLWYLHRDGYEEGKTEVQAKWNADKLKQAEAQEQALIAYANQLKLAEEQHDHDQAVIDRLHDDARRVRIHFIPACAGAGQDGAAGILPARMDQLFAGFQERVGGIIARCDQLNIDAIRANGGR